LVAWEKTEGGIHLQKWIDIMQRVPQGSVLDHLLFVIYINDLDDCMVTRISKFADDTKISETDARMLACFI